MPLYCYVCERCDVEFESLARIDERHSQRCEKCGEKAKLVLPRRAPGLTLFRPGWWRDLDYNPVYINNPQELRDYCDRGNKRVPYLEDGIFKTSPGPDASQEGARELLEGRGGKAPSDGGS